MLYGVLGYALVGIHLFANLIKVASYYLPRPLVTLINDLLFSFSSKKRLTRKTAQGKILARKDIIDVALVFLLLT